MRKRGQTLAEASVIISLFATFLIITANFLPVAEDAQQRATSAVASYSGRLLAARGEPLQWDCAGAKWENGVPTTVAAFRLQNGTALNPVACMMGFSRPSVPTCADYYVSSARLFSLPCQEMDEDILLVSGEQWGHVRISGANGVYRVVITRQEGGVTFRHSALITFDEGGGW